MQPSDKTPVQEPSHANPFDLKNVPPELMQNQPKGVPEFTFNPDAFEFNPGAEEKQEQTHLSSLEYREGDHAKISETPPSEDYVETLPLIKFDDPLMEQSINQFIRELLETHHRKVPLSKNINKKVIDDSGKKLINLYVRDYWAEPLNDTICRFFKTGQLPIDVLNQIRQALTSASNNRNLDSIGLFTEIVNIINNNTVLLQQGQNVLDHLRKQANGNEALFRKYLAALSIAYLYKQNIEAHLIKISAVPLSPDNVAELVEVRNILSASIKDNSSLFILDRISYKYVVDNLERFNNSAEIDIFLERLGNLILGAIGGIECPDISQAKQDFLQDYATTQYLTEPQEDTIKKYYTVFQQTF
jgi:hypothetical protein